MYVYIYICDTYRSRYAAKYTYIGIMQGLEFEVCHVSQIMQNQMQNQPASDMESEILYAYPTLMYLNFA